MTDNPENTYLAERRGLAEMLFRGVKKVKQISDGFAFSYLNDPAWVSRLVEFIRLEQTVCVGVFTFDLVFDAEHHLVWMNWRGSKILIQREMDYLDHVHNPLGKITLLKDDPLVSVILLMQHEGENIVNTIKSVFEQVRPPVEIVVVDHGSPHAVSVQDLWDSRIKLIRHVDHADAIGRGIMDSQGEIVGWLDAPMGIPPAMLPNMIHQLERVEMVIGSRYIKDGADEQAGWPALKNRWVNRLAQRWVSQDIHDYSSGLVFVRRTVFNKVVPIGVPFMTFVAQAQRKGIKITEVPFRFTGHLSNSFYQLLRSK